MKQNIEIGEDSLLQLLIIKYWWIGAVLILLIASTFLVFNLHRVDERCILTSPLYCEEFSRSNGEISLILRNAAGRSLNIEAIRLVENDKVCGTYFGNHLLRGAEAKQFKINGKCKTEALRLKVDYSWSDSGLAHFIDGQLLAKKSTGKTSD